MEPSSKTPKPCALSQRLGREQLREKAVRTGDCQRLPVQRSEPERYVAQGRLRRIPGGGDFSTDLGKQVGFKCGGGEGTVQVWQGGK